MNANHSNCSYKEIWQKIVNSSKILLLSHVRPDGDAIGSQISLGASLEGIGKDVFLINEDGCPDNLKFLKGSEKILKPNNYESAADLCIVLDTANFERVGSTCRQLAEDCDSIINIDHHITNEKYGDQYFVDPEAPATAQIVYELICSHQLPISEESRDAIFIGLSTDTGGFRYPATTSRSFEIGADLIKLGADCGKLSSNMYERYSLKRIELLKELLGNLKISSCGRIASWILDMDTKLRLSLKPEDSENLTDLIRGINTVEVAVFFEELKYDYVRISMRSKNTNVADVSKICANFGGGGHPLASGAKTKGDVFKVADEVLGYIDRTII